MQKNRAYKPLLIPNLMPNSAWTTQIIPITFQEVVFFLMICLSFFLFFFFFLQSYKSFKYILNSGFVFCGISVSENMCVCMVCTSYGFLLLFFSGCLLYSLPVCLFLFFILLFARFLLFSNDIKKEMCILMGGRSGSGSHIQNIMKKNC